MFEVCKYFIIFALISFFGWVGEEIYAILIAKTKTNRGYLVGPFCPVYGFGGLLLLFILHFFGDNYIVLFIACILSFAFIEYFGSLLLEKVFNIKLWNYEHKEFKYNIQGRIALETLIPFGIIGTVCYKFIYPFFYNLINNLNPTVLYIISAIVFTLGMIDYIYSTIVIIKIGKNNKNTNKDITDKKNEKVIKQLQDTNENVKKQIINNNKTIQKQIKKTNKNIKRQIKKTKEKLKK